MQDLEKNLLPKRIFNNRNNETHHIFPTNYLLVFYFYIPINIIIFTLSLTVLTNIFNQLVTLYDEISPVYINKEPLIGTLHYINTLLILYSILIKIDL